MDQEREGIFKKKVSSQGGKFCSLRVLFSNGKRKLLRMFEENRFPAYTHFSLTTTTWICHRHFNFAVSQETKVITVHKFIIVPSVLVSWRAAYLTFV